MSEIIKKISQLNQGTPLETDIIPYVDLATNTTKKALKSELKGDQGNPGAAATVDAGTTTTLAAGESATVTNSGTTSAAIFNFAIPQGIQGLTGANGACVESVSFVGNDIVFTLDDNSTVTLTNAKIDLKGDKGDTGAKITSAEFVGNDLVFTLDDSSTVTITGAKTALKGDKGDTGLTGIDWQGAWSAGTYTVTQGVAHNGSSWIATTSTTEEPSISATDWDLIALKGTDGAGSGDISGSGTANELAYFTAEKTIDNLPVATYPSLTELSYVKGVTSAIQTQLNGKQDALGFTAENSANKETSALDTSTTKYPCNNVVKEAVDAKASLTGTETLTNKRIPPRVTSETSSATPTINTDNTDVHRITALATDITSMATNLSGTPTHGQKLIIEITGTAARAITWGASFEASTVALPTTTVTTAMLSVGFAYNSATSKWRCLASA